MPAAALAVTAARCPGFRPRVGIILGSGLGGLAERIVDATVIPYAELPGFPQPGIAGHAGRLILGRLNGLAVACFAGRAHVYEGEGGAAMRVPIRLLRALGADTLLATNAAGSLSPGIDPGSLMLISDHINFLGVNPLTGANDDAVGPRFPSMRDAYDPALRARLRRVARTAAIRVAQGVYLAYAGPSFETPAEIRAFRILGADAVGMSTVPEVILARHCGLKVAAISVVTNLAEGLGGAPLSHEQTLKVAAAAAGDLQRLLEAFAGDLAHG